MNRTFVIATGLASLVLMVLACAPASQAAAQGTAQDPVIEHLQPRRDSIGGIPQLYEWTAVKGAHHYSIEVSTEVGQVILSQDGITSTRYEWPKEGQLDMGTYFWSVTAWSEDRAIAGSGLAAFVVNR